MLKKSIFTGTRVVIPAPDGLSTNNKKTPSPLPAQKRPTPPKDMDRMRWNYKLLGKQPSFQGPQQGQSQQQNNTTGGNENDAQVSYNGDASQQKLARHELYIPPKLSLCDYFLKKVISVFFFFLNSLSNFYSNNW